MLIDGPQPADPDRLPKLMEHPSSGRCVSQAGEPPPRGLFEQLPHQQIERMRGGQHRQQMRAPELRRTQGVPPPASKTTWTNLGNEVIGCVRTHHFKQMVGAHRWQSQTHVQTLTQSCQQNTPLVSA
jgi:hypothetical protein